jgi:hypothetical protein
MRKRRLMPQLVGPIGRAENSFISGITELPVRIDG